MERQNFVHVQMYRVVLHGKPVITNLITAKMTSSFLNLIQMDRINTRLCNVRIRIKKDDFTIFGKLSVLSKFELHLDERVLFQL